MRNPGLKPFVVAALGSLILSCDHSDYTSSEAPASFAGFEHVGRRRTTKKHEYVHSATGLEFVYIDGGSFAMGSPLSEAERAADEGPIHGVTLSPFLIAKYEVSQEVWEKVMKTNPSKFVGARLPVENVTRSDCEKFCAKVGLKLPTEAQWEYACRAGTSTPFSFGPNVTPAQVNYNGDYPYDEAAKGESHGKTIAVDSLQPNDFGLYQMHGNVREWCEDVYDSEFYSKPAAREQDPVCTSGSDRYVVRGGAWQFPANMSRSADRYMVPPDRRNDGTGFRPVFATH